MIHSDLESTYETLALTIDKIGENNSERVLAKVALRLAQAIGDADKVHEHIQEAAASFDIQN